VVITLTFGLAPSAGDHCECNCGQWQGSGLGRNLHVCLRPSHLRLIKARQHTLLVLLLQLFQRLVWQAGSCEEQWQGTSTGGAEPASVTDVA